MAEITPSQQRLSTADVVWSSNSITASRSARALLFENRGLLLALPADSVSEVIEAPRVTDVPGSPAWFNGVCVYRSQPVPVVDVARYLQAGTADLTFNRGIVVRVASSSYLLVADRILNLCNLPATDHEQMHTGLHGTPDYAKHRVISRVCQYDNRLLALIDLPELLRCTKLLRECAVE